jgi:putative uncharacterized protein P4(21)n (fragment)
VIRVSTFSFKLLNQSTALAILFCHSKENGFVTIQTVKDQSSFATSATIGAAQVQVHQPKPQVIKIISAHSKTAFNSSLDSSAAFLPISGLAPAQSPFVDVFQIFNFVLASELKSACVSVFTAINSTQSSHVSIILFTAF